MEKISFKGETPRKKEEEKISRRNFLKKAAQAGAVVLGAGAVAACDRLGGFSEEELKEMDKREREKRKKAMEDEPDIMGKHLENRYAGYADLEHFLKDYPEVRENPEELAEARRYFQEN